MNQETKGVLSKMTKLIGKTIELISYSQKINYISREASVKSPSEASIQSTTCMSKKTVTWSNDLDTNSPQAELTLEMAEPNVEMTHPIEAVEPNDESSLIASEPTLASPTFSMLMEVNHQRMSDYKQLEIGKIENGFITKAASIWGASSNENYFKIQIEPDDARLDELGELITHLSQYYNDDQDCSCPTVPLFEGQFVVVPFEGEIGLYRAVITKLDYKEIDQPKVHVDHLDYYSSDILPIKSIRPLDRGTPQTDEFFQIPWGVHFLLFHNDEHVVELNQEIQEKRWKYYRNRFC